MSSPSRLAQDMSQYNQGARTGGVLSQDAAQRQESEYIEQQRYEKSRKLWEKRQKEKAEADEIRRQELYKQIQRVPPSLTRSKTTKRLFDKREELRKNIITKNRAIISQLGINKNISGPLGGTARDILYGDSDVPLRQTSSHVQKQVSQAKLIWSLESGKYEGSIQDYESAHKGIISSFEEKKREEKAIRRQHSVNVAQGKAAQGVQQNFVAGSGFSANRTAVPKRQKITTGTGSGTSLNPFKASQPNKNLVSPLLKNNMNANRSAQIQGPARATYTVNTPDGKTRTFKDRKTAEKFVNRTEGSYVKPDSSIGVAGTLDFLYGDKTQAPKETKPDVKIIDTKRYDDFGKAAVAGFTSSIRYADAVDSGEAPKPQGIQWLNYYASKGLKPITDIPLSVDQLVRGTDHKIQPTLVDTALDVPISLATEGKTKTHDPIGDYIRKDPLGAALQAPAEAALWITGGKAVKVAAKGVSRVSPIGVQSLKLPIDNKMQTVYKGVTVRDKPIIGVQEGKIVRGFDESKLPFEKIDPSKFGRYGFEAAQSSGIAAETTFAPKTLRSMVKKGVITPQSEERAVTAVDLFKSTKGVKTKVGEFGDTPIEGLSQKQSDYLLQYSAKAQKSGKIEAFHGSTALRPQVSPALRTRAGSHLKLGDLDLNPKGKTLEAQEKTASSIIDDLGKNFPLEKGQSISIVNKAGNISSNKQLILKTPDGKEKKVLEVVLEQRDASGIEGLQVRLGEKVLGERLSTKTVKTTDVGLKVKERRFQQQENIRTVLGFHKGKDSLLTIYPSEGRTKDIVRSYWNFKEDALRVGGKKGKAIDIKAEKYRSLYKGVDFEDLPTERVSLLSVKAPSVPPSKLDTTIGGSVLKGSALTEITQPRGITQKSTRPQITSRSTASTRSIQSTRSIIGSTSTKIPRPSSKGIPSSSKIPKASVRSPKVSSSTPRLFGSVKRPSTKSPRSSSTKITSAKTPSTKSALGGGGQISSRVGIRTPSHGGDPLRTTKRPKPILLPKFRNKTDKKKGKVKLPHDFLGNTKLNDIVGLFKRTEVIHGDRRLPKQIKKDSLARLPKSKVKVF